MKHIVHTIADSDQPRIKHAGKEDLPHLNTLADLLDPHREIDYFQTCLDKQNKGARDIFIALLDRIYTGYVMLNYTPRYPLYQKLGIPEVQDLRVHPAYRRRGIGQALVKHCEHAAKDNKYDAVGIGVGLDPSFGPAQRLYIRPDSQ
jgi:GNAT superfamily N-acetyltransferase